MKFISSNTRFYMAVIELLIFPSLFIFVFDYFTLTKPSIFKDYHGLVLVRYYIALVLNYVFFWFLLKTYNCIKIHHLKKTWSYPELLDSLKILKQEKFNNRNTCQPKNQEETKNIVDNTIFIKQEQKISPLNLLYYTWLRNSHTQKGFNILIITLLLFVFTDFITGLVSLGLAIVAFGLLFWGLAKIARGYIEIV